MSTLGERAVRALQGIRPPQGYRNWMRVHGMCDGEVLTCRCVSKAEAQAYEETEGVYDARYAEYESIPEGRSAVLTCSSCGGQTLVRYRPGEKDSRGLRQPPSIEWWSPTDGTSLVNDIGHNMMCPQCGWECRLRRASDMTHGIPEISWIVTAHRMEDTLYLVKWHIERRLFERREEWAEKAVEALCFDGRQKARLTQYRRFMYGYIFEGWSERARFDDTVGRCVFCPEAFPSLEGTALENCRLREFTEATEGTESCCPAAWLRLWEKHKNAEVLIDAGMGGLIGELMTNECRVPVYYGYGAQERWRAPKLKDIDWKKRRPADMLGMTAPELARVRKEVHDGKTLAFLLEHKGRATELLDLLAVTGWFLEAEAVLKISGEKKPMWVAGYLKKQGRRAVYLTDYRRMAEACGLDLAHERVRWPKDLTRAHDEAADLERKLKREKEAAENAGRWEAMNKRLQGLAWARGGICIRPAASTEELVTEGKVLRHCVGGYTDTHLRGNIILFVRHERRPERSWFTLNINLENRTRIQLHGYGNERANGKELHIPKEVLEFVDAWEEADIANITVSELERLVQEKNGLHEQLSFLQAEAKTDAAMKLETEEKLRKLEREIEQLRSEPVPVQVKEIVKEDPAAQERIKELEQQVQEEALRAARRVEEEREAAKKAVQEAKAEKAEAVKKAMEKAAEEARAAALKEAEEKAEAEKKERAAEQEAMLAEMEALRKKAAAGEAMASKELAEFAVLLKKVQQDVRRMREIAEGMEDAAQREKLEKALEALRGVI